MDPTTAMTTPPPGVAAAPVHVPRSRAVVAVVVEWRGRVALLRRSGPTDGHRGRWDCVTSGLEHEGAWAQQALAAIFAATGLKARAIDTLEALTVLDVVDDAGLPWQVHVLRATTRQRRLVLGDGHDAHRWVAPAVVRRFGNRVPWLDDVLGAAASTARRAMDERGS